MRWRKCTWVSCRKASRTQQRFNERGMRTKQALVVILGVALVALLRLSPKAVDMGNPVILVQPPPEDTNCYPASIGGPGGGYGQSAEAGQSSRVVISRALEELELARALARLKGAGYALGR